jgi:hypothetical protein
VLNKDAIPHQVLGSFDDPGLTVTPRDSPMRARSRRLGKRIRVLALNEGGGDGEGDMERREG